ncbi:MAG TPA: uroporphyrinogen-III C-methyltransferase [Pyrinomonadaceae bacterium]|jgi:uroporphyrin-III C-methyltransferase|nr:uroporphyrinogen-III C-methyltransferase [Pyrinomonadaceae bacterium]
MRDEKRSGLLVVGHGSRRREANEDVREAARRIGERGGFRLVEPAFLEIAQPDIAEGFKRLIDRGATNVTVHPYFLSPGRHTRGDLPHKVSAVAACYPGVRYQITEPLSAHPLVIEASIERIRETESSASDVSGVHATRRGTVYLVGAGPGDPGLLTLRAREVLTSCDVIIYDYLIDPDVLSFASPRAERIYAGKVGHGRHTSQSEINQLLVEHARLGRCVVRLKGGDPFIFGRGGEEAEALHEAGIPFEVVPGISSALAVPAYAGIPLTHRKYSSSVAILTGTRSIDEDNLSASVADLSSADTIVVLMGVANLRVIAADVIGSGRDPATPVAVIRWGTYETQQTVVGTLESIADDVEAAGIRPPGVIVIGEVVRLRERVKWIGKELAESAELQAVYATIQ